LLLKIIFFFNLPLLFDFFKKFFSLVFERKTLKKEQLKYRIFSFSPCSERALTAGAKPSLMVFSDFFFLWRKI
jgi:hypothetical protein